MKTFYTLFLSTTLIIIAVNLSSCGDNCNVDCDSIKEAPQEFLDYWFFPEGSWWVYQLQDSTQEIFDTITLAGSAEYYSNVEIGCYDNSYDPCIKRHDLYLEHSNEDYYQSAKERLGGESLNCLYNSGNKKWYLLQASSTLKLHSFETFVLYPFDTLDRYSYSSKLCELNEPFEFKGKEYRSFSICQPIDPVGERQMYHEMTYAQGIGLVSITYDNGETWRLVEYNVNP